MRGGPSDDGLWALAAERTTEEWAGLLVPLLQDLQAAERGQRPDREVALAVTETDPQDAAEAMTVATWWGLVQEVEDDDATPIVTAAGHQYVAADGDVERAVLEFLPHVIDNLDARSELLIAGRILVEEFHEAICSGDAVEYARSIVPPAFAPAVTEEVAINLFAAAVALTTRLSDGEPAGCVGEEVMALALMSLAKEGLLGDVEDGHLAQDAANTAIAELPQLFELFGDADVLDMLAMEEPSDAALAAATPRNVGAAITDQRIQRWFVPFWRVAPTGYLRPDGMTARP